MKWNPLLSADHDIIIVTHKVYDTHNSLVFWWSRGFSILAREAYGIYNLVNTGMEELLTNNIDIHTPTLDHYSKLMAEEVTDCSPLLKNILTDGTA